MVPRAFRVTFKEPSAAALTALPQSMCLLLSQKNPSRLPRRSLPTENHCPSSTTRTATVSGRFMFITSTMPASRMYSPAVGACSSIRRRIRTVTTSVTHVTTVPRWRTRTRRTPTRTALVITATTAPDSMTVLTRTTTALLMVATPVQTRTSASRSIHRVVLRSSRRATVIKPVVRIWLTMPT